MERKLCKCSGQATFPSPSYMWVDNRLKGFSKMDRSSQFEKPLRGRRIQDSMKCMQRFKTRWEETTCHEALLLVPKILTMLDPPTCEGDLLGKKSQLDLRLFGVGVPSMGRKVMSWPWCHTEASKITLSIESVWLMQWVMEWVWEAPTLQREIKVKVSSRLKGISANLAKNTQHKGMHRLWHSSQHRCDIPNIQGKITRTTLTY